MSLIEIENLSFSYKSQTKPVLSGINLNIEEGSFITILGPNGCGKSTFARLLNGLLTPSDGTVSVDGLTTSDVHNIPEIRRTVGMVFQNPENQIVGDTVEEDVAFGLENMGVPIEEMSKRIDWALSSCGLEHLRNRSTSKLSGGQKQRVAIAAAVAMGTRCIVLDEATSMLDPQGRKDVNSLLHTLNTKDGTTVISITHFVNECTSSDRVIVFGQNKVVLDGKPEEVFSHSGILQTLGLEVPLVTQLGLELGLGSIVTTDAFARVVAGGI